MASTPRKAFVLENQFDHIPLLLIFQPLFPPFAEEGVSMESVPCLTLAQVVEKWKWVRKHGSDLSQLWDKGFLFLCLKKQGGGSLEM